MANYLGFIDETGVLHNVPEQRFFALGLLKCEDTSILYQELQTLKNRVESRMNQERRSKGLEPIKGGFEFKFADITDSFKKHYFDLIDSYSKFSALQFSCLVIDKNNSNIQNIFPDTWEAYINYSKMLINKSVVGEDEICIIADFLGKPKVSNKFFEPEIRKVKGVYNAAFLESHSSLFIQLVDVLVGCVVFDFRRSRQPNVKHDSVKGKVTDFLKNKLGVEDLAKNIAIEHPSCFNIWELDSVRKGK